MHQSAALEGHSPWARCTNGSLVLRTDVSLHVLGELSTRVRSFAMLNTLTSVL